MHKRGVLLTLNSSLRDPFQREQSKIRKGLKLQFITMHKEGILLLDSNTKTKPLFLLVFLKEVQITLILPIFKDRRNKN
jgi:hypothetical protein